MAFHGAMIEEFKGKKDSLTQGEKEDQEIVMGFQMHAADLNNSALHFDNYIVWAKLITMEFVDQTVSEQKAGIPVTNMFLYKDELTFYKGQQFFVGVLVAPLFKEICGYFPELTMIDGLNKNLEKLKKKVEQLTPAEK